MQPIRQIVLICFLILSSPGWAVLPDYDADGNKLPSLAPLLAEVNPSVVNIATFSTRAPQQNPLLQDPSFRRYFGLPEEQKPARKMPRSAGSGVIIDAKKGIVLTNHHVIHLAEDIHVSLHDGRSYKAALLGSDPEVDIAVLQLKDFKRLTAIELGDSERLRQGDFVLAIGNPFGLGHTATQGIISAIGRSGLGIEGYENFIQTDASINPGNSGGALINLRGELIGINTAIFSPAGGNIGIGFAIPVNMAQVSVEQILLHGEVRRGVLGVIIQDLSPEMAEAFDLDDLQRGAIIADVQAGSGADDAGLQAGDVVIAIEGKSVASAAQLRNQIGIRRIGDTVKLSVIREGRKKNLSATIGERPKLAARGAFPVFEGVEFEEGRGGKGLSVVSIEPGSPAAASGLEVGDVILSYNRFPVNSFKDLQALAQQPAKRIVLRVKRGSAALYLVVQ